jgi:uncharacterized membrane-anchored protein YitT (DUF2179 family)
MTEDSPYQSPSPQGPPKFLPVPVLEPPSVKVFGILHLVFAGLGILGAIWGLVMTFMGNPFLKFTPPSAQLDAQIALQERLAPMTGTNSILSLLVAVPMIIAGVRLLKKRGSGLKWSNIYGVCSLLAKAVNAVFTLVIYVPAMREMTRSIVDTSHTPGAVSDIMSASIAGGALIGIVISCVYPGLTLFLLNRPATRAWFARQPG